MDEQEGERGTFGDGSDKASSGLKPYCSINTRLASLHDSLLDSATIKTEYKLRFFSLITKFESK